MKAILKDIKKIIRDQKLDIYPENSIHFIMDSEDSDQFIGGYDLDKFRKNCRWNQIKSEEDPKNPKLYKLSEAFIVRFIDDLTWHRVSSNIYLTESFIAKNADKVSWPMISQHQKLSESFIAKFSHKVSWSKISVGQTHLSEEFIWNFRNRLTLNNILIFNNNLSYEFKNQIKSMRFSG